MPQQIFLSYSHKDTESGQGQPPRDWPTIFKKLLSGFFNTQLSVWSDRDIVASTNWQESINRAISESRIALLLVGRNFLTSDFIAREEFPAIVRQYEAGGLSIVWVPIDDITADERRRIPTLNTLQAAGGQSKPLRQLGDQELDEALGRIRETLSRIIDLQKDTSDNFRVALKSRVVASVGRLGIRVGPDFAAGDYSIFYKAEQNDRILAVKALVPAPGRESIAKDFVKRARVVQMINDPSAISIRNIVPESDPVVSWVVMDFIEDKTLAELMKSGQRLPAKSVATVIAQLAHVAVELHDGSQHILGPVQPNHVHFDGDRARVSLLPIANETLESCRISPTKLLNATELPYLSPERYYGEPIDKRTDQYHLGILALELLTGTHPISIKAFSDLKSSAAFFESPRASFPEGLRHGQPALSFIVARMLARDPTRRWASFPHLIKALTQVAEENVPDVIKDYVRDRYRAKLRADEAFFRSFYHTLFKRADIKKLFEDRGVNEESQAGNLRQTIASILHPAYSTSFEELTRKHSEFVIEDEYYGLFRDAFLAALRDADKDLDEEAREESQDAWRAVLDPALAYMRQQISIMRSAAPSPTALT
jgi:serine/threonine protein kinase